MATINEIIAKRNELQATNPNATNVDARKALTPAPVTGVPPTTPGSFNAKTQGMNVAERQAVRAGMTTPTTPTAPQVTGVDGQKFTQAPVDPTTGLSKPIAPTVQPTPTVPKTDSTPGITQADLQKAQAESEKIKAQNEGQINLNKQQSDLKEQERQRAITEQNNALANNEWAILNTLKIGGVIPESVKTSPYYKSAQSTYNNLQKFSSYSTTDLVTAMNQGAILPGTQVYNEMMKDPAMKTKLSEAQAYRSTKPVNIPQIEEVASSEILANNPVTAGMLDDGVITIDEYNNATNTPEVIAQAKVKEEKINKYNTLKAEYDAIEDEVDAQFPASPFAAAIKADRQKAKYKNLILAQGEMDSAIGALNDIKATSSALFEANLQNQQSNIAFQRQKEMADYQSQLNLKQNQAEFDQKIAQQTQLASDPTTAIGGILNQFAELGIVADRDLAWHLAEQKRLGMTLPEYTKKMIEDFKKKPEYTQVMARKSAEGTAYQTFGDKVYKQNPDGTLTLTNIDPRSAPTPSTVDTKPFKVGDETYQLNPATGQYEKLTPGTQTSATATGSIVPVTAGNKTVRLDAVGSTGFSSAVSQLEQAGIPIVVAEGYRDQVETIKSMASRYGIAFNASNPAETAQKLRSAGHQVADPGKSEHENGMAIDVYGSGKLDAVTPAQEKILNANGWYSAGIPGDAGHFEYKGVQGTGTQVSQYSDQNIADLSYLTELQEKNPTQAAKDMKGLGYTARDLANYKSGNVPLTEKQKTTSFDVMSAIKDLTNNDRYEWNDAVGKFDPTRIIGSQDAEDANVAINNLVAKLTLPNLGVLKGPMSDKDIQFIKEASSKLSTTQSNESFERNLIDAYNLAARRAGQPEIKALSDLSTDSQSTVGGEAEYSKYE